MQRLVLKERQKIKRYRLLVNFIRLTEIPMIVLGFVWLILLIVELVWVVIPAIELASTVIWIVFIIDFIIKFIIAPSKGIFLKKNLITIISLFVPALRVFRVLAGLRALRSIGLIRSLRVVRVIGSLNRGIRLLETTLERRAFGYVLLVTLMVSAVGSAAMFGFEKQVGNFDSYGEALWWTVMLMTTIASETWPQTPEGRFVCFILSVYGLAVLGYFTAMLASFFIGQDARDAKGEIAGAKNMNILIDEMRSLKEELKSLKDERES